MRSTLDQTQKRLDASYQYCLHGPLARMELGDINAKVRGVDYAYTLQGIKDQGTGIKPKDNKKIIDRYYRVQSDQNKHIAGFGIGLYLSAEIINRHNGDIWVESKKDQGSTFYFNLPINPEDINKAMAAD